MPHNMYIFVNTDIYQTTVRIAHDSGWNAQGVPGTNAEGRAGLYFSVPDTVPHSQGAQVDVSAPGKTTASQRGLLYYLDDVSAYMMIDDFYLQDVPVAPPTPGPQPPDQPASNEPLDIINWVYSKGYNLALKSECGRFTEDCCTQLHNRNNQTWGHIKKDPGQNQWNGHAVDAVQCLGGEENGIWDIIVSSESTSAHPAYNRAGDAKPELWYYPANAGDAHTMMVISATNVKAYIKKQLAKR